MKSERFRRYEALRSLAALLTLTGGLWMGNTHAADDAFVCMEESQEKCDYENRNMELFIKGRDAFDRGRETGDFREAYSHAAELIARKDVRHGSGLMKFIYPPARAGRPQEPRGSLSLGGRGHCCRRDLQATGPPARAGSDRSQDDAGTTRRSKAVGKV